MAAWAECNSILGIVWTTFSKWANMMDLKVELPIRELEWPVFLA